MHHSYRSLKRFVRRQFVLQREEEETKTYEEIYEGVQFKGYNLWILAIAMIIASIGLNVDSPSAIIGAMLMSPLMGPAIGFAFGLAIDDAALRKTCLKNWLLMTLTSLCAASVYFLISPFDKDTSALASYKQATIFDILIAFFGGMAGFLGIVKREGIKIIAGVAVATACMPPLCTASYGIAHADWSFFVGGLYYYLINTLFIGLATYILARYLKFHHPPPGSYRQRTAMWFWQFLIVLMAVPGLYIAYLKWDEQHSIMASTVSPDKLRIQRMEAKIRAMDSMIYVLQVEQQKNAVLHNVPNRAKKAQP